MAYVGVNARLCRNTLELYGLLRLKKGYDLELTRAVSESVGIPVIASGGAGELKHFYDAFTVGKADAVLAASLFHFNEIPIESLKKYLKEKNIPVRPV